MEAKIQITLDHKIVVLCCTGRSVCLPAKCAKKSFLVVVFQKVISKSQCVLVDHVFCGVRVEERSHVSQPGVCWCALRLHSLSQLHSHTSHPTFHMVRCTPLSLMVSQQTMWWKQQVQRYPVPLQIGGSAIHLLTPVKFENFSGLVKSIKAKTKTIQTIKAKLNRTKQTLTPTWNTNTDCAFRLFPYFGHKQSVLLHNHCWEMWCGKWRTTRCRLENNVWSFGCPRCLTHVFESVTSLFSKKTKAARLPAATFRRFQQRCFPVKTRTQATNVCVRVARSHSHPSRGAQLLTN